MAVDVGHAERADGVAQPGERARDQRAAAAEQQRAPAGGDRLADGRAHRRRRGQHVRDADHAGLRVARVAADLHVEVATILGADARDEAAVAQRGRRVLGAAGPPDGVDRHPDHGPRLRHHSPTSRSSSSPICDLVAGAELATAPLLRLAVDEHGILGEERSRLAAGVDHTGDLEQRAEADHAAPDLDLTGHGSHT